jgi:hypothetical protein
MPLNKETTAGHLAIGNRPFAPSIWCMLALNWLKVYATDGRSHSHSKSFDKVIHWERINNREFEDCRF